MQETPSEKNLKRLYQAHGRPTAPAIGESYFTKSLATIASLKAQYQANKSPQVGLRYAVHLAHFRRYLKKLPAVRLDLRTSTEFLDEDFLPDLLSQTKNEIELNCKVLDTYVMKVVNKKSNAKLTLVNSVK